MSSRLFIQPVMSIKHFTGLDRANLGAEPSAFFSSVGYGRFDETGFVLAF